MIGIILTRLYRRATKDVALIRTGFGFRDHSWGVRNLANPLALPTTFFC